MSTLKADTIQNTSGGAVTLTKQQAAKHWVNYDAVNQTTDGSFNQSSLTDNAEGDFTSIYTNGLSSASDKCIMTNSFNTANDGSSANSGSARGGSNSDQAGDSSQSTSSINFHTYYLSSGSANADFEDMNGSYCMTIGDLA